MGDVMQDLYLIDMESVEANTLNWARQTYIPQRRSWEDGNKG